jgi:hypothetical protein
MHSETANSDAWAEPELRDIYAANSGSNRRVLQMPQQRCIGVDDAVRKYIPMRALVVVETSNGAGL